MRTGIRMDHKQLDLVALLAYAAAFVTGLAGGCAAEFARRIRNGQRSAEHLAVRTASLVAYAIVGGFAGLMLVALLDIKDWIDPTIENFVFYGGIGSVVVSVLLITVNFGSRLVMRYKGFEAEIVFRKVDKEAKHGRRGERRHSDTDQ